MHCVVLAAFAARGGAQERETLRDGWAIQSSAEVGTDGARISAPTYRATGWHRATVPSTVVGTLVDDSVYRDPFFGMNLRALPGMSYKIGQNFAHLPMDSTSPFAVPWWYRRTFRVPGAMRGRRLVLHFDGINYRANVWLNGRRLADSSQVVGTYRRYDFDVTDAVAAGPNALAVEVFAPTPPDLQTTWVDWNPSPPDKDMGIWQPVSLVASGSVVLRDPQVVSHVDTATLRRAELTVGTELRNLGPRPVTGTLRGRIEGVSFSRTVTLAPNDSAYVAFTPDSFPQLRFTSPRLWWPVELGRPELYTLDLSFTAGGRVSDRQRVRFGIREITSETTARGGRLLVVNGRRILVRGGGWAPDIFFRPQPERQDAQLRYALDMHLNTIRLEGNYEDDRFWQRTDSLGLLVMTGWVCCDAWEEWAKWGPEQYAVAAASLRDQIRRLRGHASALVWLNGSDNPPPANVEQTYLDIEREEHWPNPTISSASAKPTRVTGASGVKMTGPYDWVPPGYWLQDSTHGGAWAYNTETSPGAAVPPIESVRRMMPERDIQWPLDSVWLFHAAGGQFTHLLDRFDTALVKRYGPPRDIDDFVEKSQLMTYEGERAMFEAYRRNKYVSTGVIQWMLNNAWPSIYWHLFDWYLRPGGGYFGTKKANEPVHAMFSYDDRSIAIVNARREPLRGVRLRARVLGLDASEQWTRDTVLDVPADSTLRVLALPEPSGISGAYFADLRLTAADGRPLSSNFYWLSTRSDVLADTSTWYMTPVKSYADYTALASMPRATVTASARFTTRGTDEDARVTLTNTSQAVAFFLRLQVTGRGGEEALPVLWSDNYLSLLPGETRVVTASFHRRDLGGAAPRVVVGGWNVSRTETR
ncbi:glycoside hydrolase family 2 sugar binding protein (plasmid) [Gemmatirosa kalamazoonensis]|uniref:Glycoside hydrolase family 2 sugar binding protein n=1 Tax=Gemmatirosa kalamazoonensis TaxID=861299 RepID=W0RTA2_9BACT|nr:sugar-binding domain-containing protein [Gemmatirosa kalamazoonensis]AHG93555.1 glycoside hydrolase family 2 sugar binding protein [Gemmatirosa kalamazoonensis]